MQIFIGSDHGGFHLKKTVKDFLLSHGYEVYDVGCESEESCDYPEFGFKTGQKVIAHPGSLGIVICGSGLGISMAANKVSGVRAAHVNSVELARLARQHNGANVLAMGERTHFIDDPLLIVETFLHTPVDESLRHKRRRDQLDHL